ALEDHPDGVEEDDLDVEEDEEHRQQVEADAEFEALHRLDRDAGLVRLALAATGGGRGLRLLRADQVVEHREDAADGESEDGEDENRKVALEHLGVGVFWWGGARRLSPVVQRP